MRKYEAGPLPKSFSPEQEKGMVCQLGTWKDEEARQALMEHNLRLVVWIVQKSYGDYPEQEDLISVGTLGMIKGVKTYDPSREKPLSAYVSKCIRNEIRMYLRKKLLTEKYAAVEWKEEFPGQIGSVEEFLFSREQEEAEKLYEALSTLTEKEQWLLQRRFGFSEKKPMTQREIAALWQVSQSYVSRVERRAVYRLKDTLTRKSATL